MAPRKKKASRRKAGRPRPRAASPQPLTLVRDLPATPAAAERAMNDVLLALADARCRCGDLDEVRMALRKALNNAVRHGSQLNPRKRVHLLCRYDSKNGLEVVVRDEGAGLDRKSTRLNSSHSHI